VADILIKLCVILVIRWCDLVAWGLLNVVEVGQNIQVNLVLIWTVRYGRYLLSTCEYPRRRPVCLLSQECFFLFVLTLLAVSCSFYQLRHNALGSAVIDCAGPVDNGYGVAQHAEFREHFNRYRILRHPFHSLQRLSFLRTCSIVNRPFVLRPLLSCGELRSFRDHFRLPIG